MPTREPKKEPTANPLFSKNIPPPPPVSEPTAAPTIEKRNGNTMNSAMIEAPAAPTRPTTKKPIEDLATIELSLYLKPAQDDKLDDLRRAYKRRTGKKISANELMRRLIDRATLESLL